MKVINEEPKGKRIEFVDRFGNQCVLRKSKLAVKEDIVELGVETLSDILTPEGPITMHLSKELAHAIICHLQAFIEAGDIDLNQEGSDNEATPAG